MLNYISDITFIKSTVKDSIMTRNGNAKVKSFNVARNWVRKLESFQTESIIPTSQVSNDVINDKFSNHFTGHGAHTFMLMGMNLCGLGLKNCDLCEGCAAGEGA